MMDGISKTNFPKVLLLAAGRGKRLMPLTSDRPKCLVVVGGRPILFWQLAALSACGIKDIAIVTGYLAPMIEKYVAENFSDLRVKFIHNPDYITTDKLHSWYMAKSVMAGSAIILDSDIIFHPAIISEALALPQETSAALFHAKECAEDETRVHVGSDGTVLDIGKDLAPDRISGKFTGIYSFSEDFSRLFFSAAGKLLNSGEPHAFGFDAIRLIRDTHNLMLRGLDVSGHPFIEIDYPDDLAVAENKIIPEIMTALKYRGEI